MNKGFILGIIISSLLVFSLGSVSSTQATVKVKKDNYDEISNSAGYLSVPFHYQNKSYYCGPATLEMVFDYYGEDIPQVEIADAARTNPSGTFTDELRRAAHFSNLSTSLGNELPDNITGYSARKFGYAAFKRQELTIENLKSLIDNGDPTIVLMWWTSLKQAAHYRVVIGYNTTHVITHDPWNKDWGGEYGGANTSMTHETFLDLWSAFDYWGLWVRPWNIELQMPSCVMSGNYFKLVVNITYLCSTPFDAIIYPSVNCNATIELHEGLELASGDTIQHSLGSISAGNSIQTSWSIHANEVGAHNISVTATGIIEGSYPYSYSDAIGGLATDSMFVVNQTCRVHNLDTGLNYTSIQAAINASETLDGHEIFVEKGVYYENVVVNKQVSLVGENKDDTFVDGEGTESVICIIADNVTITGFTIQNSGRAISGTVPDAGINVRYANNCNISRNHLTNNYVGIFVRPSTNSWFTENIMIGNHIGIDINNQSTLNIVSGNSLQENNVSLHVYYADFNVFFENKLTDSLVGVTVRYSNNNTFSQNEIRNGLNGMILDGTAFNDIIKNIVADLEYGIQLKDYADHNIVSENSIKNCSYAGIDLDKHTCDNSLSKNTIEKSEVGIDISNWSVNNTIFRNQLNANLVGMHFWYANLNEIFENVMMNNYAGAVILYSQSNRFYHNTLLNNTQQLITSSNYTNCLDNSYPSGGNYWSDYTGTDSNTDGIGDTPYIIDADNTDYYPLMGMFSDFNATSARHVQTICNSSISDFQFNGTAIHFNVSGENGTAGFCRVCILAALMNDTFRVFVNGTEILPPPEPLPCSNSTHNYLYFTYSHSTQAVIITPEFPFSILLPLFMTATLPAALAYKRRRSTPS